MSAGQPIRAVLLDLDGTLLDTAPDMANALNLLRRERGVPVLSYEAIRPHVSHGAAAMIRLGFPDAPDDEVVDLRGRFLELYREHLAGGTRLFDGFESVLATLEGRGVPWGIVTNKPAFLTEPLLAALGLEKRAACVVSGDTVAQRKPHPAPMLHAAKLIAHEPAHCLYVGDAQRDVQAARAAGMRVVVALFGYLADSDRPESWEADALIATPAALLEWIEHRDETDPRGVAS